MALVHSTEPLSGTRNFTLVDLPVTDDVVVLPIGSQNGDAFVTDVVNVGVAAAGPARASRSPTTRIADPAHSLRRFIAPRNLGRHARVARETKSSSRLLERTTLFNANFAVSRRLRMDKKIISVLHC